MQEHLGLNKIVDWSKFISLNDGELKVKDVLYNEYLIDNIS